MTKLLVLQHGVTEGLGNFEEVLTEKGFTWDILYKHKSDTIPSVDKYLEQYSGLISMGGPMSANDILKEKFLRDENNLLVQLLELKRPILGVCLGAQMLAQACGMKVYSRGEKRIGWYEIKFDDNYSKRNPLFFQLDPKLHIFHWHGETFDVPTEGYRLATSEGNPAEAFCFNGNAYGLQFHPEMTMDMIRAWIKENPNEVTKAHAEKMLREAETYLPALAKASRRIIIGFLATCRDSKTQASGVA